MTDDIVILPAAQAPTQQPAQTRARITILSSLYHSLPGESVAGPDPVKTYRWLDSDEQAYERTVKVGEGWQELDLGWLKDKEIAYIFFKNDTKRLPGKTPTPEELDELAAKVIDVGVAIQVDIGETNIYPIMAFLPEEGTGYTPIDPNKLWVKCRKGVAKLTYYVVPA